MFLVIHNINFNKKILECCHIQEEAEKVIFKHRDRLINKYSLNVEMLRKGLDDFNYKCDRLEAYEKATKNIWSAKPYTLDDIENDISQEIKDNEDRIAVLRDNDWTKWLNRFNESLYIETVDEEEDTNLSNIIGKLTKENGVKIIKNISNTQRWVNLPHVMGELGSEKIKIKTDSNLNCNIQCPLCGMVVHSDNDNHVCDTIITKELLCKTYI